MTAESTFDREVEVREDDEPRVSVAPRSAETREEGAGSRGAAARSAHGGVFAGHLSTRSVYVPSAVSRRM